MSSRVFRVLGFAAIIVVATAMAPAAARADVAYNSEASFLTAIAPGYYLEDFHAYDGLPDGGGPAGAFVNFGPVNGFSYTATAPTNGLFAVQLGGNNGALSTNNPNESLILTFTGDPVTAVGGLFFPTNGEGLPTNGSVTVTLDDGSSQTIVNDATAFTGFTTDLPIASLTISTSGGSVWPAVDHLYVGAAVPEPATMAIWSLLGGVFGITTWRRRRQAA